VDDSITESRFVKSKCLGAARRLVLLEKIISANQLISRLGGLCSLFGVDFISRADSRIATKEADPYKHHCGKDVSYAYRSGFGRSRRARAFVS
jgi:hypothetical protein